MGKTDKGTNLEVDWRRIEAGLSNADETIRVAIETGKRKEARFVPKLIQLLDSEDPEARYYSLQSLVIDLKWSDGGIQQRCWKMLLEDPDDYVRSMAATCLGSIFFGSRSRVIFSRLLHELKGLDQPPLAKAMIYSALFKVVGRPPLEWPGVLGPRKVFEEADVDWAKIAWLEDQLDRE